jgi:hypothetical protein
MKVANVPLRFSISALLLVFLVYLPLVFGADDDEKLKLEDIFRVKAGPVAGGLDNHKAVVQL